MRKVIFGVACSLDGFIAGPDGAIDWLCFSDEVQTIMSDIFDATDTLVFGRKTYEMGKEMGHPMQPGMKNYVCSSTLDPNADDAVTVVSEDAAKFVEKLKHEDGKNICIMAGGSLGSALLQAGVIDELGLNIHPILLGSGVPLFQAMKVLPALELVSSRKIAHGCVCVNYRVLAQATRDRC